MNPIPPEYIDLLQDEKRAFAHLATLMKDGSPQVTPVWFDWDGTHLRINSARGRVKDRNMRANSHVAVAISDPHDPYRYLQIRGKVISISEQGAWEHINTLSMKYRGTPYPRNPGEIRVLYLIQPLSVSSY